MDRELPEVARGKTAAYVVMVGLLATLIGAAAISWWASSDPTVALENDLADAFVTSFGGLADESWCQDRCSGSGHEWHSQGDLMSTAELVAEQARRAGAQATIEPGATGVVTVRVRRESIEMLVGVSDPAWINATDTADGVSVWFTSETVLDRLGIEPGSGP